nr:ribonuclease P protein component [Corynebacterium sp. c6VSa_13]
MKFTSPTQFDRTIRRGRRGGSRRVVVHFWDPTSGADAPLVTVGGPRFGFIVAKAVGNSVVRHGLARKLRAICREIASDPEVGLPAGAHVVVRALPAAASASSAQLSRDIVKALRRARA